MKSYKTYLLPYAFHTLLFELTFGLYSPRTLHPYLYFYPAGIARLFPPRLSRALLVYGFYCSMSLCDCCIAMNLERYYAMKNLTNRPSKVPFCTFCILSGISLGYLGTIMTAVFYEPLNRIFIIPEEILEPYIASIFSDLDKIIDVKTVIAFRIGKNALPSVTILIAILVTSRVVIALATLCLTAVTSRRLKTLESHTLHRHNVMLLRMTYLQFLGFSILLVAPLVNTYYASLFIEEPSNIVNYSFAVTNFFGLYDTLVTAFCIKPYRTVFLSFFKNYLCPWGRTRISNNYSVKEKHRQNIFFFINKK